MTDNNKRKRHITAGEVITVIIVVLCLAAGLALSFLNFSEKAYISDVENSAMKAYSLMEDINVRVDDISSLGDYPSVIKEFFPDIFEYGMSKDSITESAKNGKMKDSQYAISSIENSASGFTFTYYKFLNEKLYEIKYTDGILGKVEVLFKTEK